MRKALAAVSTASGSNFDAAATCADETLAIKVKDVTVRDLMTRISDVSHAEWKQVSGGWRLQRSSSTIAELTKFEAEGRARRYEAAIKSLVDRVAKVPKFDAAKGRELKSLMKKMRDAIQNGTLPPRLDGNSMPPRDRGMATVLSAVDPKMFASIPVGARVVFSTSPNAMQRSLPGKVMNGLRNYIEEYRLYTEATKADSPNGGAQIVVGGLVNFDGDLNLGIGKVVLIATRPGAADDITLQLMIADPNGKSLGGDNFGLSVPRVPVSRQGEGFTFTPLSLELSKLRMSGPASGQRVFRTVVRSSGGSTIVSSTGDDAPSKYAPGELRKRMLDPEKFEPHGFGTTEALFGLADAKHANLVAWIPDTSFVPMNAAISTDKFALDSILEGPSAFDLNVQSDSSWINVSALRPMTALQSKVNRTALGKVLRVIDQNQSLPISAALDFAGAQAKAPTAFDIDGLYLSSIDSSASGALLGYNGSPYSGFRFLAALPVALRTQLVAGAKVPIANLPAGASEMLSHDVFQSVDGPSKILPPSPNRSVQSLVIMRGAMMSSMGGSLETERTEFMPAGMPQLGYISLATSTSDAMLAADSTNSHRKVVTAQDLGWQRVMSTDPRFGQANYPTYAKFRPAKTTSYDLTITFNDLATLGRSFNDVSVDLTRQEMDYNQLPSDFKKQAEESAQRAQQGLSRSPRSGPIKPS